MPYSTNGRNSMLDGIGATHLSLHNDIPNDTGSNEITGGSPAYARVAVTFNSASGGTKDKNATDPMFDVPAGETIYFVGMWDMASGGNFKGFLPVNGGDDGVGQGLDTGDVIEAPAHGLSDNDRVYLRGPAGNALPGGLDETTIYHVVGSTTDTFQVSLTQGGGAVSITSNGQVYFQKTIPETFGVQSELTVDTVTLKAES